MSYELIGPDTDGMGALNLRRGTAVVKRVLHTPAKRKAWGFYSGARAVAARRFNTGFGSGFPSQVVTLGVLPGLVFGAKLVAAPIISSLFGPSNCQKYGVDDPRCSLNRNPMILKMRAALATAGARAASARTAAAQLSTRTISTATPAPPAVMTVNPSAGVPVSAVVEMPGSVPESMNYGSGGGAAAASYQATDTATEAPAPPVSKGAGMFVPLAIGALALFTMTRRKRKGA